MSSSNLTPAQQFIRMVEKNNSESNSNIYEIPTEEQLNDDLSTEPKVQMHPFLETLHRRIDLLMKLEEEKKEEKNDSSDSDDGDSSDDESFVLDVEPADFTEPQETVEEPRDLAESVCSILRRRMEEPWNKEKIMPQIAVAAEIRELKLALEKERKEHQETRSKLKTCEEELRTQLHTAFQDNLKFQELEQEKGAELLQLELDEANRKCRNMKSFFEGKLDEKDREIWEKEATVTQVRLRIQKLEEEKNKDEFMPPAAVSPVAPMKMGIPNCAMAQRVPPGDIVTQLITKIMANPYGHKITYHQHFKVINSSARRIGYCIKTTERVRVDRTCGVLDPKEEVILIVSFNRIFGEMDDKTAVEWTNAPDGADKQFRCEWFEGDGMIRRKNLPIEYNP